MGDSRNMTHMVNVERFISDVFNRPAIWHRSYHLNKAFMEDTWDELAEIHNLPKKTLKCKWKGLRDNFRVEFKRIPRDELTGDLLITPEEFDSKWANYKPLLFLAEHLRSRSGKNEFDGANNYYLNGDSLGGNSNDFDDISGDDQKELLNYCEEKTIINNPQISLRPVESLTQTNPTIPRIKVKANGLLQESTAKRTKHDPFTDDYTPPQPSSPPSNIDDDYHFLMSLHPYMVQLNASQKLRVRMKIQKVIFKELFKDEEDIEEITK